MIQEFRFARFKLLFDLEPELFESDRNLLWYAQNRQPPEPEVIAVMLRALKPGDCVVDAGANVGFFTVLMSKLVGDRGRVLAIEPDPRNLAKLHKTIDMNSCGNVTVVPYALGRTRGEGFLHEHEDNGQSSMFGAAEGEHTVPVDTFDHMLLKLPRHPTFIKLDIEGSETEAIESLSYRCPCVVTEMNSQALQRAGSSVRDLMIIMKHRGYQRYVLHADGSLPSLISEDQVVVPKRENANMLFALPGVVPKQLWPEVEL